MHAMILNCLVWFTLHYAENQPPTPTHWVVSVGGIVGGLGIQGGNLAHWCTKLHKLLTYSNQ